MTSRHHQKRITGFSLVELLFAMAIISTLAAVAALNLSNVSESGRSAKSRHNAQSICEVYQSAVSVGAVFTSTTKEGILNELIAGKNGAGSFATSRFQVPLADDEKASALAHCTYDAAAKLLVYRPRGN